MFRNLLHKQEHFNTWGIKNNFIDDPISAFKFEKKNSTPKGKGS